jgi:hypothetical protein
MLQAPTRPSYCHPWADGVTHWLAHSLAGIVPLAPGYLRYAALPHLSHVESDRGRVNQHVSATAPTPHGPITVTAHRDVTKERAGVAQTQTVTISVTAAVSGIVGLRLHDEATGCERVTHTLFDTCAGCCGRSLWLAHPHVRTDHPVSPLRTTSHRIMSSPLALQFVRPPHPGAEAPVAVGSAPTAPMRKCGG